MGRLRKQKGRTQAGDNYFLCGIPDKDFVRYILNVKDPSAITCVAIRIEAPVPDFVKVWYELRDGDKVLLADWVQTNWKRPDELNLDSGAVMTPEDRVNFVKSIILRHMSNRVEMTRAAASGDMAALQAHLKAGDLMVK